MRKGQLFKNCFQELIFIGLELTPFSPCHILLCACIVPYSLVPLFCRLTLMFATSFQFLGCFPASSVTDTVNHYPLLSHILIHT